MVYINWKSSKAAVMESMSWYELPEITQFLQRILRFSSLKNVAYQVLLHQLDKLQDHAPYSKTARFHEDKIYICEQDDNYREKFQRLRIELSSEKVRVDKLIETVNDIFSCIVSQTSVIDRAYFETHFGVEWDPPRPYRLIPIDNDPRGEVYIYN